MIDFFDLLLAMFLRVAYFYGKNQSDVRSEIVHYHDCLVKSFKQATI